MNKKQIYIFHIFFSNNTPGKLFKKSFDTCLFNMNFFKQFQQLC